MNRGREIAYSVLGALFIALAPVVYHIQAKEYQSPFSPRKTIIAFDVHSVIVKFDRKQAFKHAFKNGPRLLGGMFNIPMARRVLKMRKQNATPEEVVRFLQERNHPKLAKAISDIANSQKPIDGTVQIIKDLKTHGYELHILSNIGSGLLEQLDKKLPGIFEPHFSKIKTVDCDRTTNIVLKKPHPDFYREYQKECNPRRKRVIFIDDKERNIKGAETVGITGILFQNPEQLRKDLERLNIL